MKKQHIVAGSMLVGFGGYFFLLEQGIEWFDGMLSWPTLIGIIGIAFLLQAYKGRSTEYILPGTILVGLALHFHLSRFVDEWPNDLGVFLLITSIAFLLHHQRTKQGLVYGLLFLALAIILVFYQQVLSWLGLVQSEFSINWSIWPVILIGIGVYLLFFRKK
ncbi:hypothetical protein Q75_10980 [Bacillus coahuilensis p1.1.43]|uniref:DUF5668 domain-containing protein n=1 Tax=Bacillus coahuilensis p1.1.43 TaxID=1150625 RepID=A0A147K752_9BACI|nr:hypothetical protein [Bacillus coahuilensis]KUP05895.1 hypothetical protein Q75_10980 [Bacillus coahuilensis p1.1.43]